VWLARRVVATQRRASGHLVKSVAIRFKFSTIKRAAGPAYAIRKRADRCSLYRSRGATETTRPSTGRLCRQRQASVMHSVFPGREGAVAAILDKVGFCASWEVVFPRGFEASPRLIEA
jgi:hypothetical protein